VDVLSLIGKLVMVTVVGGPPQGPPLDGRVAQKGEEKGPEAGGLEGVVGKIAVIKAGNAKHADYIQKQSGPQGRRAPAHEKNPQAHDVQEDEGDDTDPVHLPFFSRGDGRPDGIIVHPADDGSPDRIFRGWRIFRVHAADFP
jgi:hypothetical protein